jgi:excisionase family DNA binding protein
MEQKIIRLRELAEYLNVNVSTVYRLIKRKKIPSFRVGRDHRFNVEEIDQWRMEKEKQTMKSGKKNV